MTRRSFDVVCHNGPTDTDPLVREIHVRPMKRKWASVSTRGRLTISQDLIEQPAEFRREVIVHELVHLKLSHGQHNKLFRSLVRAYLEDQGAP